jgi:predicted Zn-dependent protease
MKQGIQLEIAMTALAANDQNKAAQAYGAVRRSLPDSAMGIAAAMNEASLLLQLDKAADAVTVLAEIEEFIPELMKTQFDERKAFALEQAGRLADALAMYETLAGKSVNSDNDFFRYKVNVLKGKLGK